MKNLIVVLSGPSGAGKGSIYKKISNMSDRTVRYVSMTTRMQREGEIPGFDYDYSSIDEFKERETQGYFLETDFYDGNYYGTPRISNIEELGKDVFFDLNANGAMKIKEAYPEAILIYILPPNLERLKRQLGNRGDARIELAKAEVPLALRYEWLVINDDLDRAASDILSIMEVIRKSRMQNSENQSFVKQFY